MRICFHDYSEWIDVKMVDFNENFLIQMARCKKCCKVKFAYRKIPHPMVGKTSISLSELKPAPVQTPNMPKCASDCDNKIYGSPACRYKGADQGTLGPDD